tara:strand:- start:1260 stop:1916 length:657 start_codon:yes stop_codon:yes gene_type:complete
MKQFTIFKPTVLSEAEMKMRSINFLEQMKERRSVRAFSRKSVPAEIIENAIKTANTAPSGANKQPWHFVVVGDQKIKNEIKIAAEKEEKAFYSQRATVSWLEDLNQFGTNWEKPFLAVAPFLIVIFKKNYDLSKTGKKKNYYVNESVGIAAGFLLAALHNAGLVALTHTPSPMAFLNEILKRPLNEKPVLLIPVGYPTQDTKIPNLKKKTFAEVSTIF